MTISEACKTLIASWPYRPSYVVSVGSGVDRIYVYLKRELYEFEKAVPDEWEGYPVEKIVTGEFIAL